MLLETIKTPTTEVYAQHGDTTITVTHRGNMEGTKLALEKAGELIGLVISINTNK